MAVLGLIICMVIALLSWKVWNDFLIPTFILSFEWILMYLILIFSVEPDKTTSGYFICFSVGLVFFFIGFIFVTPKKKISSKRNEPKEDNITFNSKMFWFLFTIQCIVVSIVILALRRSLQNFYMNNLWFSIINAGRYGNYNVSFIVERLKIFVQVFAVVTFAVYMLNKTKQNKRYFILTFLVSIPIIFTMSRGGMIMIVITLFFIFLNVKNYINSKIAKWGIVSIIIIILIFSITSVWKFQNIAEYANNPMLLIKYAFKNYFATSMINFVEWAKTYKDYLYGQNTFRFILAIFSSLGFNVEVVGTVQEFRDFSLGDTKVASNVYTILHYYASDFGIWFSFIIQLFLGMFHGFLYRKANLASKSNLFYTIMFALLMFPLLNQFFDDKYISTLSSWVQYYFWTLLLTRTKYFIVKDKRKAVLSYKAVKDTVSDKKSTDNYIVRSKENE